MTDDRRDQQPEDEDLFEDLDQYFEPLANTDWPEQQPPEGEPPAERLTSDEPTAADVAEGAESLEGFDVDIEVPDEADLVAPVPEGPQEPSEPAAEPSAEVSPEEPPAGTPEPAVEEAAVADAAERVGAGAAAGAEGQPAGAPEPSAGEVDEEDVVPEDLALSAEDLFEEEAEEPGPARIEAAGHGAADIEPEGADRPAPEAVEAAADHFAEGLRESAEEVERELLADLEEGGEEGAKEPAAAGTTIEGGPAAPLADATMAAEAPTWEEGGQPVITEEPAEAPTPGPPGGRNLVAAFISGGLLAAAVIALLAIGKGPFVWLVGAVVLLGQAEFYAVMRTRGLQPATLLGLVCGALIIAGAYLRGPSAALLGLFLSIGLSVLWYMAAPAKARRNTTVNVGATVLGAVYVPFLASFAVLLLALPGGLGRNAFLVVVGLTVLYDVCAYAIGTLWGTRPLAPTISPQKSWEGAIGATFVLLLVALAIVPQFAPFDAPGRAVGLALVIAVVAPLGDLVESALKRDLGVKDMGTILPGHGGVLDRVDAILFAAPAAYYFLQLSF